MKRTSTALLVVSIFACVLASACFAGSYQGVCGIPFNGAADDRGIGVNRNPASQYYGYFYGATNTNACVRIWKPVSGGTAATSYVDSGRKLSYATAPPGGTRIHFAFVGPDDVVWVADHLARQICTGTPDGHPTADPGELVAQFQPSNNPRSIFVTGGLGVAGTRVYVAMNDPVKKCEVWNYDGAAWSLEKDLGDLGLASVWFVTVDSSGNSYWAANSGGTGVVVKKVDSSFNVVATFGISRPSWLTIWTVGGITCTTDPADPVHPEYLYVSAYNKTSVLRFDLDGNYIDGYGNLAATVPPAGTWTTIALSGPGGQQCLWVTADDQHNTYIMTTYPSTLQAYKFHLQSPPQPPTGLSASNDVYGQIRLSWTPPPASVNDPTSYKIYRDWGSGNETLYGTTADAYPKWKDTAQNTTPGGPFYYIVKSANGEGEGGASDEVGPISVAASTAPAPGSLGVALIYSEVNKADTVGNGNYDGDWNSVDKFLTDHGVSYTKVYDADPAQLNVENDDIAGHKLLVLGSHRDMSGYEAQCIKDYAKFSQGRVLASYNDSIADYKGTRGANYQLADVYRANALGLGINGSPWVSDPKYQFLKKIPTAPEAAAIFASIGGPPETMDGAQAWSFNHYLIGAYTDGTASEVGKWYDSAGVQPIADPNDVGIVVGYTDASKTSVQCVLMSSFWWVQATGTVSAAKFVENILSFLNVPNTPPAPLAISALKQKTDGSAVLAFGKIVTKGTIDPQYVSGTITVPARPVFYIEETDCTSGIKVALPSGALSTLTNGQVVSFGGVMRTQNGERVIVANDLYLGAAATAAKPVCIGLRGIAGGIAAAGLDSVGLLVNICGNVTASQTYGPNGALCFVIDDGYGAVFGSQTVPGIKVYGTTFTDTLGAMIHVPGVIGSELDTDGTTVIPVIRIGDSDWADAYPP